jgi:thioesterase domain-containing protein
MGRLDHQVKLRGYRIELGEIEAVLATYPGVKQAVVLVREDVPGDQRLVAYLMAESEPDSSELRALARSRLPEYMVPSAWVTLETFPLTPNRKVDRKALPAPEGSAVESGTEFVAPRTPYEEALTEIWVEVLGLEQVGVRDNFFEIGGHSLLALRLRASMEKKFNQEIPLAILFIAPTIEQLAEKLDEGIQPSAWTSLVPMQTEGSNPPFFCVPEAGSTVYSLADLARHLGPNQPFYGLQPMGMEEDLTPHARIEDMAAHYVKEIKEFQPQGPYMLGGQCFGAEVAFEMAQQLIAQGDEVELLALIGDNRIASWTRKGVDSTESAYSLKHALQRTFYYLRRFPLGDVYRTARRELNIRFNPRLQYTRRVFKAQLLARTSYVRKPYPGRVTAFSASASLSRKFASSAMAGLAQGGVEVQRVPPASDLLLHEPHVQVVAANLRACIAKAATRMSDASSRASGTGLDRGEKEQRATGAADSAVAAGSGALSAGLLAMAGGNRLELSLVLPCHNEAHHFRDNMEEVVRALDSAELNYEIIVVDDASTDGTAEQIRSFLSDQSGGNIRALFHDTRRGRGATLAEGIRKARSPYAGFIDINLETPPQFIPAAVDQLRNEAADMVVGNRQTIRGLEAPLQLALSNTYRQLASLLLETDSLDTASSFKFFRREMILPVLDGVQDSHSLWDTELTVLARAKGLRAASLPVSYRRHLTEQSTVQALRAAWRSFASLFAVAKRQRVARQG